MTDIFTGLALVGAAVSTAAWAIAVAKLRIGNGERGEEKSKSAIFNSPFSILNFS